jgi:hypothetical protein
MLSLSAALPDLSLAGKFFVRSKRERPASLDCSDLTIFLLKRFTERNKINPTPFLEDIF